MKKSVKILLSISILVALNVSYGKLISKKNNSVNDTKKIKIDEKESEKKDINTPENIDEKSEKVEDIPADNSEKNEVIVEEIKEETSSTDNSEAVEEIVEEVKTPEDKALEDQIGSEWETQENEEKISQEIDLKDEIRLENVEYTIKKGDTIYDLSREYKIKSDYIYANNLNSNLRVLQIGKKINIPTADGIFYTIKKGDTFNAIAQKFDVKVETIKEDNKIDTLLIGAEIFLREPKVSRYLKGSSNEYAARPRVSGFANPLLSMVVTSGYGNRNHPVLKRVLSHGALDLRAKTGTKVMAAKSGTVTYAGNARGYGKVIIVKHPDGYETRYAHLSKINVRKGQRIDQNQIIALSGATGRVTGPHLHFEIRKNGKVQNPLEYLKM